MDPFQDFWTGIQMAAYWMHANHPYWVWTSAGLFALALIGWAREEHRAAQNARNLQLIASRIRKNGE